MTGLQKIIDTQQRLIAAAESDQITNPLSTVSETTITWMYRMLHAAESAIIEVEGDVTVNVQTNAIAAEYAALSEPGEAGK